MYSVCQGLFFLMKHFFFFLNKMQPLCSLGQLCFTEALEGPSWVQESLSGAPEWQFVAFSILGPQLLLCSKTYRIRLGVSSLTGLSSHCVPCHLPSSEQVSKLFCVRTGWILCSPRLRCPQS